MPEMNAIVAREPGGPEVLELARRPVRRPGRARCCCASPPPG